jgi:hypothetical protein
MSDQPASSPALAPAPSDWLTRMSQKRREVGYLLLALAIACLVAGVAAGMRAVTPGSQTEGGTRGVEIHNDYFMLTLAAGFLTLVMAGGAIYQLLWENRAGHERDSSRLLVMALGALTGVAAVLFIGLGLTIAWRDVILGGWSVWKGADGWKVWVVIAGLFGGLALMFVSIQLARADERTTPGLRRLLYGFNAVFTAMLLAAILLFVNLLAYAPWGPLAALGKEYTWAQRNLYAIDSENTKILENLDKPTKVYAILPGNHPFYFATLALLENCKDIVNDNAKFDFEMLSPDRDPQRVNQLMKDCHFDERAGLLIVYGSGADSAFIKDGELQGAADSRSRAPRFNGEQVLMTELNLLQQGKSRPVIYITQGNGELDMSGKPGGVPFERIDLLKSVLEQSRFKVKGLQFLPVEKPPDGDLVFAKEVPADAGVLIIPGPRQPLPQFALDAIKDYLDKRKGKAMIFFDVAVGADGKTMVRTGLEEMMKKYNVVVGDDRVMKYDNNLRLDPVQVVATFPQGKGLSGELTRMIRGLLIVDTRTVYPAEKPTGPYRTESLLEVPGSQVWAEKDLSTDPRRLLTRLTDRENAKELAQRLTATRRPVTIAVTVAEVPVGGPHAMMEGESVPQMIVYGDATWLSNAFWGEQGMAQVLGIVLQRNLGWLKQRPVILTPKTNKSDTFMLPPNVSFGRTVLLPGVLMMAGIIGLGAGVWVVRRR